MGISSKWDQVEVQLAGRVSVGQTHRAPAGPACPKQKLQAVFFFFFAVVFVLPCLTFPTAPESFPNLSGMCRDVTHPYTSRPWTCTSSALCLLGAEQP